MDWKLQVVVLPVSDVDRAKAFYEEQCGFHVDVDRTFSPTFRVVQVTPPGSACSISFGNGLGSGMAPGSVKGLQLVVADIHAARAELAGRGVDCTPVQMFVDGVRQDGHGGPHNAFVFFQDPDGNAWAVQEGPAA